MKTPHHMLQSLEIFFVFIFIFYIEIPKKCLIPITNIKPATIISKQTIGPDIELGTQSFPNNCACVTERQSIDKYYWNSLRLP